MRPIPNASISILGIGSDIVTTGINGRFRVTDVGAGRFLVTIRRLSYRPLTVTLRVTPQDTVRPSFTMSSAAQTLDPVIVNDVAPSLSEFQQRRLAGEGNFSTRMKCGG